MHTRTAARVDRQAFPAWLTNRRDAIHDKGLNSAAAWLALMAYPLLADVLLRRHPPGPGRSQLCPEGFTALAVRRRDAGYLVYEPRRPGSRQLLRGRSSKPRVEAPEGHGPADPRA